MLRCFFFSLWGKNYSNVIAYENEDYGNQIIMITRYIIQGTLYHVAAELLSHVPLLLNNDRSKLTIFKVMIGLHVQESDIGFFHVTSY